MNTIIIYFVGNVLRQVEDDKVADPVCVHMLNGSPPKGGKKAIIARVPRGICYRLARVHMWLSIDSLGMLPAYRWSDIDRFLFGMEFIDQRSKKSKSSIYLSKE